MRGLEGAKGSFSAAEIFVQGEFSREMYEHSPFLPPADLLRIPIPARLQSQGAVQSSWQRRRQGRWCLCAVSQDTRHSSQPEWRL